MTTITINPCPFCGYGDVYLVEAGADTMAAWCPECRAQGPDDKEAFGAIRLWNVRAPVAEVAA